MLLPCFFPPVLQVKSCRGSDPPELEMGISDFGEMHRLSKIARPDICVMTNIGQCHLEFLHDRDGILRSKSEERLMPASIRASSTPLV